MSILGGWGLRSCLFHLFRGVGVKNLGKYAHIILERSLRYKQLQFVIYLKLLVGINDSLASRLSLSDILYKSIVNISFLLNIDKVRNVC